MILDELEHWNKCAQLHTKGHFNMITVLLVELKEYRNLLAFRFFGRGDRFIFKRLFRPMEILYIYCRDIGPRLFIQHGFSTTISAKSIGSDCWINQQVTIGYTFAPNAPLIGNGVRLSAGAKVVGSIAIGDNAIIAANAAVVKDVPENAAVGGVPAKIIGENLEHMLFVK